MSYGSNLISVGRIIPNAPSSTFSYFNFDGLGSVRALTNSNGVVTDTYDYDSFGILIRRTGTTTNNYLYRGEQYDPDLGMYSLRARFYNQSSGRFWNQDSYEGSSGDPASLHKYLYANADPVMGRDPTGHGLLLDVSLAAWDIGTTAMIAYPTITSVVGVGFSVLNVVAFATSEEYRSALINSGAAGAAEVLVADAFSIASAGVKLMQYSEGYAASQALLDDMGVVISSAAAKIGSQYPGAFVGIRGSLARGASFDKATKGLKPFNDANWDVDAFVVSDRMASESTLAGKFRFNPKLKALENGVRGDLKKLPGYRNDKPFTFRVFTTQEWMTYSKEPFTAAENPPSY